MERHHGLGLRAQILLALSAAFLLSFTALGLTVVSLAQRAQELERVRRVEAAAEALAVALSPDAQSSPSPEAMARLVGHADVMGLALVAPNDTRIELGNTRGAPTASTLMANGDKLSVWASPLDPDTTSPLSALLRFYLVLTALAILALTYVALTRLIVRPVENLTVASERLSTAAHADSVPVAGAAELARLSVSFNRMAADLRAEKQALVQRLKELERTTRELEATQDQLIRS